MSTPENIRSKRPLGVYLFTLAYSVPAALALMLTLSALPVANATLYNENPWDTETGPVTAIASLIVLVSSVATFRGSRIGRACLTASLGMLLACMFAFAVSLVPEFRGAPDCSLSAACGVRAAWQYGPPGLWVTLALLYSFHCWYFYGPRTRQFYSTPKNA